MLLDTLRTRRSIRKFTDESIDAAVVADLKEVVLRSMSSRGINPWGFYFVTDKAMLDKLSQAKEHGSALIKGSALAVVICADSSKSDV